MEQTHIIMGMAIFACVGALVSIVFWRMERGTGSMNSMKEL